MFTLMGQENDWILANVLKIWKNIENMLKFWLKQQMAFINDVRTRNLNWKKCVFICRTRENILQNRVSWVFFLSQNKSHSSTKVMNCGPATNKFFFQPVILIKRHCQLCLLKHFILSIFSRNRNLWTKTCYVMSKANLKSIDFPEAGRSNGHGWITVKGQNVFFSEGKTLNVAKESHSDNSDLESSIVKNLSWGYSEKRS